MRKYFLIFTFYLVSLAAHATDIPMDIVVLRGLDKVTGRTSTFSIPIGEVGHFGKTLIVPDSCYSRPPEESPENAAFLFVFEKSLKGENIELFKGWMFSSNPALSSMEHPVYDIWVVECQEAPKKLSEEKIVENIPKIEQEISTQPNALPEKQAQPISFEQNKQPESGTDIVPVIKQSEDL